MCTYPPSAKRLLPIVVCFRRIPGVATACSGVGRFGKVGQQLMSLRIHRPRQRVRHRTRTNVPAAGSALIGRAAAIQHLQDVLTAYRVVTLTGPGGIGKTALALEVSRQMLPSYGGDVLVAELVSLADPGLVPSTVAAALNLPPGSDMTSAEAIARAIGTARLLLVLDNCEHVINAVAGLAEAVVRLCPNVSMLATTQEVLRIDGEYVYRVPTLDIPSEHEENLATILHHSAVEMFIKRTTDLRSDFLIDHTNLPAIVAVCRRLDGIPLAIEFAAARAATLGVEQVAKRLDDRFKLLTDGRRTALPRHQTLRATLDWSYELLPQREQCLLRRLAVFAAGFTLEGAEAVSGNSNGGTSEVIDDVAKLVSKSLIMLAGSVSSRRWRLLETIRIYASEKLTESGEVAETARRHAEYYRRLFEGPDAKSNTQARLEWLATRGNEIDDVRAALDWSFSSDGDPDLGVALTVAVVPLLIQLSLLSECRERTERALSALADNPTTAPARMRLSAALGWSLMYGVGRARETGTAWSRTLELAETLDDTEYRRHALWGLCVDQFNTGNVRTALSFAERFADLVGGSGGGIEQMMADRILATSLHYLGDQNRARYHIDRALAHDAAALSGSRTVSAGFDLLVSAHYFQARILWLHGFAKRALRVIALNVEEGRDSGRPCPFAASWASRLVRSRCFPAMSTPQSDTGRCCSSIPNGIRSAFGTFGPVALMAWSAHGVAMSMTACGLSEVAGLV